MAMFCDRTPPWFPTTCNMFWYKDFLCCFFRFHFVRISSDFSSGALWQNVLPQDFATNSFVRISLRFRQNLNWSNEIFDEISTIFLCGKMLWQNVLPQGFWSKKIVEISSKISLLQLKFDEIWTIFLTKIWRSFNDFFLWQNFENDIVKISSKNSFKFRQTWVEVTKSLTKFQRFFLIKNVVAKRGKTFCHNILPQKKCRNFVQNFVEISSNLSWSNEIFDAISTKFSRSFFVAKGVAKWIATRIATKSSTKALTNSQRPTDVIPFLLQIMSSTNTSYVSLPEGRFCLIATYLWETTQRSRSSLGPVGRVISSPICAWATCATNHENDLWNAVSMWHLSHKR